MRGKNLTAIRFCNKIKSILYLPARAKGENREGK